MVNLLKAFFAVGVLWLVGRAVDWDAAIANVSRLSLETIVLGFCLLLIQLLIVSQRLRSVLMMLGQSVSYWVVFRATAEGAFFGQALISLLGSDAARIWRCQRSGVPLVVATSGVLLDRLVGLAGNHFMLLAALPWVLPRINDIWVKSSLWLLAIGFTAGIAIVCILGTIAVPQILKPGGRFAKLAPLFDLARVSRHLFRRDSRALVVFSYSILVNLMNVGLFYVLLRDLGADIEFVDCLIVVPIIIQVSLIPISIGGWGVRESAAVIGFSFWGVSGDIALTSSVLFGLLTLFFSLWGGMLWWIDRRRPKPEMPAP